MEALFTADNMIALATLTALEVVLGVDNVIFISILAGKLPAAQQARARRVGLLAAMIMRILLLFSLFWLSHIETPLNLGAFTVTPREIVFTVGGVFLLWKSVFELGGVLFGNDGRDRADTRRQPDEFC